MLELLLGTLLGIVIIATIGTKYFLQGFLKGIEEQQKRIIKIAENQQSLSKTLIEFIDKNINERVVYPDPNAVAYSNEDKLREEKEIVDEGFESFEDMSVEEFREQMENNKEGKK
jgi:hypothetical protein